MLRNRKSRPKRTAKTQLGAKRVRKKAITLWRGKRSKVKEKVERVYSQRWETKQGVSPMVAYKSYKAQQTISGESTAIKSAEYDPKTLVLRIIFWGYKQRYEGSEYAYYGVPEQIWIGLNEASSKGRFFYYMIRSKYNYSRVSGGGKLRGAISGFKKFKKG